MLSLSENTFVVLLVVNHWKLCNYMWLSFTYKWSLHLIFLGLPCLLLQSYFKWTNAFMLRDRLAIWCSLGILNRKKWILHVFLLLQWVAPHSMEVSYVCFLESGYFQHFNLEIALLKLRCSNFTSASCTHCLPSFQKCVSSRASSFHSMTWTFL